jgi:DNA restriction-modification system, DNA methylase
LILGESGDVLEALTRVPELREKYVGKVKCVYIDPPFNTSQTFANYEDNLEHSVWLTMMRDRLLHLRNLLSDDGSIWVHLDDVENHRMRVLLDEIFGSENFVTEVIWQKADGPRNDANYFSSDHDVILVYRKTAAFAINRLPRTADMNSRFKNPDNDPKGAWAAADPCAPGAATHQGMVYAIQHPVTGELMYPSTQRHWTDSQATMLANMQQWAEYELRDIGDAAARAHICGIKIEDIRPNVLGIMLTEPLENSRKKVFKKIRSGMTQPNLVFTKNGYGRIMRKTWPSQKGQVPRTIFINEDVSHNRGAIKEIRALFPDGTTFSTPKPERLLERIIHIATNPNDIILDVFAGSGTTAAVAQKMGRRWVTCELREDTFERFIKSRLTKVINNEDDGGTTTENKRIPAPGVKVPEKFTVNDMQKATKLLNAIQKLDGISNEQVAALKVVKSIIATRPSQKRNWLGGGSFRVARLSPTCYDYDPEVGLTTLTEAATGQTLIKSVAANLDFRLTPHDLVFDGVRGRQHLAVIEGTLNRDKVDDLVEHLKKHHSILFAAITVDEGVREYVRQLKNGSRVIQIPLDIFPYSNTHGRK